MTTAHLNPTPTPLPAIEPLEMLYVTNGSLLTAEGWWQAHRYYQHRQNLHYQSLHQPGIVSGLGVKTVPAPDSVPSELRDRRWLEIQPGLAIDLVGNPLVVEEPMTFRITSEVVSQGTAPRSESTSNQDTNGAVTVYVVLAYVDPTAKQWQTPPTALVKEEFRINERTTPPDANEVELCRIHLTSNVEPLENAVDVFNPAPQAIDLRYRQQAQTRAHHLVHVGVFSPSSVSEQASPAPAQSSQSSRSLPQRWSALLQSLPGLYPPLAGVGTVQSIPLTPQRQPDDVNPQLPHNLPNVTLLAMSYDEAIALTSSELEQLQVYLAHGCTVLVEYDNRDRLKYLDSLNTIQNDLAEALADLQTLPSGTDSDTSTSANAELHQIRQGLRNELSACQVTFQNQIQAIGRSLNRWGQAVPDLSFTPSDSFVSLLVQQPYLFDELPQLPTGPVRLLIDDGIILVIGSLSAAWTPQQFASPLSRSTMRDAQELGINILNYASARQQMIQAQQG